MTDADADEDAMTVTTNVDVPLGSEEGFVIIVTGSAVEVIVVGSCMDAEVVGITAAGGEVATVGLWRKHCENEDQERTGSYSHY